MKRTAIVFVAASLAALLAASAPADRTVVDPPETRTFEITYRAMVQDLPKGAGEVEIWIPYPTDDEAQQVEVLGVAAR
ncbi:MAG TPA: hypothetical protein VMR44_02470, partial [Thermoanaerobaculia bacterium]|nr:hypothetical protein [Thermoanaerobaculia bacterium]